MDALAEAVLNSAAELPETEWDTLLGRNDFYSSSSWLGHVELMGSASWGYLQRRADGRLRAGMTVHEMGLGASPFNRVDHRVVNACRKAEPEADVPADLLRDLLVPALNCGGRTIGHSRVLTHADARGEEAADDTRALLARAEEIARQRGLRSVCALYVDGEDTGFRSALREAGFAEFENGRSSVLDIDFTDFEEYLGRFSKQSRKSYRKERRRIHEAGVRIDVERMDGTNSRIIAAQGAANSRRYGWDVTESETQHGHDVSMRALPGRNELLVARDAQGDPIGTLAFLQWRDEFYVREIGFDYDRLDGLPLYFEISFYRMIEEALARGVRLIDYTIEQEATKRSRGCRQSMRYAYVKCLDPAGQKDIAELLARTGGRS
ncbi:GNAT family N-acetyltransferase [Streptomyces sp. NPDC001890]|uniref:GNAT family N-acetyltransferase n=1 Tax=Streptomyces sp. NPDC001890 TaxID=3364620 RepID=UPI0036D112B1